MHEWLGKSVLNNEQTVGWPSVHWPCTQSTGMVCELCWVFYRFFNWIQYTFFPCLEVRPGNMFHGVFLFDFFSHWMGFTFENYLLQINFVKTTHSLMSTCHYFSLSLWYPAFSPQPSKSGIVFPNSQPTTHYPWSILQPELFKVRHWGNSHCCWSTTDRKLLCCNFKQPCLLFTKANKSVQDQLQWKGGFSTLLLLENVIVSF